MAARFLILPPVYTENPLSLVSAQKSSLPHPGRMRRVLLLNSFGAVGNRNRRQAVPAGVSRTARNVPSRNSAGEQRVLPPFSRRKKVVAAAACTKGSWFWPRGQTTPKICENMSADNRQHPISRYRAATSFCQQTKGRKSCFPPLCSRGKRNDLPIISTPRFKLSDFPRLAGRWLSRPIAVRYL